MGGSQEGMVLQGPPQGLPTNSPTSHCAATNLRATTSPTSRPLQLCRWIRQLAGWMVCWQEGLVLQDAWERMSWTDWMCHNIQAIRLSRWICQLAGRLVRGQEGLVLQK